MKNNFENWWRFLKFWEGEISDDENDPGGLTIYGFSYRWNKEIVEELLHLYKSDKKVAEIRAQYYAKTIYWDNLTCDALPHKLDIVIADTHFLQGPTAAKKVLYDIGKDYEILKKDFNEKHCWILALLRRFDYLDDISFKNYSQHGRGWSKRILSLYDYLISNFQILHYD